MRQQQQLDAASPDAAGQTANGGGGSARAGNMSQAAGESDLELRWRDSASRNNGKLKLAAVVHYDSLERLGGGGDEDQDEAELSWPGKHDSEDVQKGGADLKRNAGRNSHVDCPAELKPKKRGRLSRLFFTKNNNGAKKSSRPTDLIDDTRRASRPSAEIDPTTSGGERSLSGCSPATTTKVEGAGGEHSPAHVIEFKFDLIVEGDRRATSPAFDGADGQGELAATAADELLRPIRQRKLLDHVNELVESFALDSIDVCLLTAGSRRLSRESSPSQFDYLLKCAKLTITYAFELLEATDGGGGGRNRSASLVAGRSPLHAAAAAHSIELEAVLFQQADTGESHSSRLDIVDLVAPAGELRNESTGEQQLATSGRECAKLGQALEVLTAIRARLDLELAPSLSNRVLMLQFKLRRQVNGATFSNRMCLLDLAQPKTSQLAHVVESVFSGQALAHLKRQKALLRTLEMDVEIQSPTGAEASSQLNSHNNNNNNNNKHFHQIASLTQLIRAEWLIYKQLSSALIKTLAIVHCHRLDTPTNQFGVGEEPDRKLLAERRLMEYNLGQLEFVQRLRRGSNMRLRRRKRHLRSHLARSELGLVSDTNLSTASSLDQLGQSSPSPPPPLAVGRRPRTARDLLIASPLRHVADLSPSISHSDRYRSLTSKDSDLRRRHLAHLDQHYNNHHYHHHRQHRHRDRQTMTTTRRYANSRHYNHHHHHHHLRRVNRASSLTRDWAASELDMLAYESSSPSSTPSSGRRSSRHAQLTPAALDNYCSQLGHSPRLAPGEPAGALRRRGDTPGLGLNLARLERKRSMTVTESDQDDSVASLSSTSLARHLNASPATGASRRCLPPASLIGGEARARNHLHRNHHHHHQLALDPPSDSNTLDDSIELQSFSSSLGHQPAQVAPMASFDQWRASHELTTAAGAAQSDCISEKCCEIKVAEPPRQLKLEEFLNQLSNFIGPAAGAAQQTAWRDQNQDHRDHDHQDHDQEATPIARGNSDQDQEQDEDDDCKSHSSILDHLSSLTLESNLKLVKQTQRRVSSTDRVSIVTDTSQSDETRIWPDGGGGGHLQSLLKSTLQLQEQSKTGGVGGKTSGPAGQQRVDLAEQLRALTIDCTTQMGPAKVDANPTSKTPPTSLDSGSCVSSASSSASSSTSGASPCSRNAAATSKLHPALGRHYSNSAAVSSQIKSP